jgi:hypothetical protein
VSRAASRGLAVLALLVCGAPRATALPTMIRLGYSDCAACHLSPQGGGPLNAYGRGIDQAQSLRGGEYEALKGPIATAIFFGGRVTQDLRTVLQTQNTWSSTGSEVTSFRPRLMYRNVTAFTGRWRVSGALTLEDRDDVAPRPALSYDPPTGPSPLFVNTALVHYRAGHGFELSAGRDQLPTGVNVPDLALFIRSRNRAGYYDAPVQIKAFIATSRMHVTPFAFAPGGNEARGDRESGAGILTDVDVLGNQRAIVGLSVLRESGANGDRRTIGAYTRLGFGRWGMLAEHDVTDRSRESASSTAFGQNATYGQLFFAVREWLVASAIAERLRVGQPFEERLIAGKLDLTARLASQATIGISGRWQVDGLTDRRTRSIAIQAAFKTVQ